MRRWRIPDRTAIRPVVVHHAGEVSALESTHECRRMGKPAAPARKLHMLHVLARFCSAQALQRSCYYKPTTRLINF